jgi:hypothetical protein
MGRAMKLARRKFLHLAAGVVASTTLAVSPASEELDAYAAEHGRLYEPVETAALIPHMLQAFLRTDRAWCAAENRFGTKSQRTRPHNTP